MQHHVRNLAKFGVRVVVAVNRFATDADSEIAMVVRAATEAGAVAVEANHWALGGAGAVDLARAVVTACAEARAAGPESFKFLYPLEASPKAKIEAICTGIYGAAAVRYSEKAEAKLASYVAAGYGSLPICMAKTHLSLSTDPALKGVPTGFSVEVRDVRASVGAGFLVAYLGDIMTVPGLPSRPGYYDVDLEVDTGRVIGLF